MVIEYNYYKYCCNNTTMLYRLLFIQGKAYLLVFKIHSISSWAVWQLYLDFIPNLRILIYRERVKQVNYLSNLYYTLAEFD
jgi:hypothetical protein